MPFTHRLAKVVKRSSYRNHILVAIKLSAPSFSISYRCYSNLKIIMFVNIFLVGLAATAVSAVPLNALRQAWGSGAPSGVSSATETFAAGPAGATSVFSFPLSNGFPNVPNPSNQLTQIEDQAHGTLPNSPIPPSVKPDSITSLQLIAFNEISEVAFFTELLENITSNAPGYTFPDSGVRQFITDAIIAAQAQEELHALFANAALTYFNVAPIQPCKYNFPVSDFQSAITLASTFTDVVLGTLGDIQIGLATNGDVGLIGAVGAVRGQEGEQDGFFRLLLDKIPSALPFLTASTRDFAFSILNQAFVLPGSCPNSNTIDLPIFDPLTVTTSPVEAQTQTLSFMVTTSSQTQANAGVFANYGLVYINQQNLPIVEPLTNIVVSGATVTFSAQFPYDQFLMNGLTIAAVTNNTGPFTSADTVASATLFGPGLIEIN